MRIIGAILIGLLIIALIGLWLHREAQWQEKLEVEQERFRAEQARLESIEETQTKLVNLGYDIGTDGIDGKLADCNTVRALNQALCDQSAIPHFER